jgi:beta-glucosidase
MKKLFCIIILAGLFSQNNIFSQNITLNKNNIDEVINAMTLEEKVRMVIGCGMSGPDAKFPGTAGRSYEIPRLGIPSVYFADGPHKLAMSVRREFDSNFYYTTEFPSGSTVAATFNPNAAYEVGKAIGTEVKDYGMDVLLAPGVNLMRNVLCGRNHEYYSEDPLIVGKIAAAYINGVQSQGIGTSIKHFAANNQETNRYSNDPKMDQRTLRELYLKGFEIAIKESSPWTIMTAYNKINGKHTSENIDLTTTILRDEWGYNGLVISDWNAGSDAIASMIAGNDMLQPGQERQYNAIYEAVKNGQLEEKILDRNVKRVLELVVKSNTFNNKSYPNETDLKAHAAISRKVGTEGIVLLTNNGVLPFSEKVNQVALYGSTSYDMVPAGQGFGSLAFGRYTVSLVEGLRNANYEVDKNLIRKYQTHLASEEKRLFPNGRPPFSLAPPPRADEFIPTAEELAEQVKSNDVAIFTIGRASSEPVDRHVREFYLTENELALLKAVSDAYHSAGKKVIVVLNICSPVETASWKSLADAIICAFQPGQEVGHCVTDILIGKVNPSGKLPVTFAINYGDAASDKNFPFDYEFKMPSFFMGSGLSIQGENEEPQEVKPVRNIDYTVYEEGIYVGYRYFDTFNKNVSFPFGHGLSYTTFNYNVINSSVNDDICSVEVTVTNTGNVSGKEVVQVYITAWRKQNDISFLSKFVSQIYSFFH